MATDYERYYQQARNALGPPTKEFVRFFEAYDRANAEVLDVGCGQGRDALFIARLGHRVTAVDLSPTGLRHLDEDAAREGLPIRTVMMDVRAFAPDQAFDVILIDRTLHMLAEDDRVTVLETLLPRTNPDAWVLIADERSNIPALAATFDESTLDWSIDLKRNGFLFVRRVA